MNMAHYSRGWHTTLSLGAPAAAAACGRLLGLNEERMAAAISLSTSLAGGSKRQFGTMMKPVHAGLAAKAGVLAAALAQAGITAADEAFTGPWSFEDMFGGTGAPGFEGVADRLGQRIAMLDYGAWVKPYPCCASTHRSIDAVLALQREHGFGAADIVSVETQVSEVAQRNLMYTAPENEMQARFSMNHCLALAIADSAVRLDGFSLAALARAELRRLWTRIGMTPDPDLPGTMAAEPGKERQSVTLRLTDGRMLAATVVFPKGHGRSPLSESELVAKFRDCATRKLPPAALSSALDALAHLASLPRVTDLTRHLHANEGDLHVDSTAR
jgi:2-methylcitrate dehydratase PrpD